MWNHACRDGWRYACVRTGRQFDIPSESASKSIPELARQAGVQIIGPGGPLQSVVTPEVKGTFDVVAVLEMMLKGTDLKVGRTAEGSSRSPLQQERTSVTTKGKQQ